MAIDNGKDCELSYMGTDRKCSVSQNSENDAGYEKHLDDSISLSDGNIDKQHNGPEGDQRNSKGYSRRSERKKRELTDDSDKDAPVSKPKGAKKAKKSIRTDDKRRKKHLKKSLLQTIKELKHRVVYELLGDE